MIDLKFLFLFDQNINFSLVLAGIHNLTFQDPNILSERRIFLSQLIASLFLLLKKRLSLYFLLFYLLDIALLLRNLRLLLRNISFEQLYLLP